MQKSNLTYIVKAENLKSLCAHFMSCDCEKLLKKHTKLIHGKIQQTLPTDGFLCHVFICSRSVVATLLHHGEDPLTQGPAGIFMQINIKGGFLDIAYH